MQDKKIKIWLVGSLALLMVVGGAASLFSTKDKFFKGLAPLSEAAQTSVLTSSDAVQKPNVDRIIQQNAERLREANSGNDSAQESAAAAQAPAPSTSQTITSTPSPDTTITGSCARGTVPVIENNEVVGCNPAAAPAAAPASAPAPQTPAGSASCESQNLFTYTGPDQPGLLYGMCIQCETMVFSAHNGTCPAH